MNYLAPIRLALVPVYWLAPGPLILLVIQNVMFWWVVPAAYTLVRSESRSEAVALSAAALVPLTPLFWPLVWNDFRELQLAGPFVLWAVQGVRSRSAGWAAVGIAGMLACRQEFAVMVATFAFLPPRDPETLSCDAPLAADDLPDRALLADVRLLRLSEIHASAGERRTRSSISSWAPRHRCVETLETSLETLLLGMGAWALLACLAPRVAILAVPWIWGPCSGRWAMRMLSTVGMARTSVMSCRWPPWCWPRA